MGLFETLEWKTIADVDLIYRRQYVYIIRIEITIYA